MTFTGKRSDIPSKTLIFIALIQGFALLLLHQSIELKFWPHNEPQWLFAFYAVAIAVPVVLLLGVSTQSKKIYHWTFGYALLLLASGYYAGNQVIPLPYIRFDNLLLVLVATLSVATFKLLMYVQHVAQTGSFSLRTLNYHTLFVLSWRNFLTLALSLLFMLCTWGVLILWAELFKAIKINFFHDLFTERWFFYPALALAHGFGVVIFRHQSSVIDTITRIQQALMKFLLVILSLVAVIFLLTLPFTGLAPLWDTGGSLLILWIQALMLFFINAVYQDNPEARPYPVWIHRFIYISIALLPIYSVISFYGLSLRVEQYGWTLSRCWAFLLWATFAAFSVGYLWGIIRLRDHWLLQLSWINVRMGLMVLLAMLLVNSPLADFRKISVDSQLQRLADGQVTLKEFDFRYLRYELSRPGYDALQRLKEEIKADHPEIALRITSFYKDQKNRAAQTSQDELLQAIDGIDDSTPKPLLDFIYSDLIDNNWRLRMNKEYRLITIDLNNDTRLEYVLAELRDDYVNFTLYYFENEQWGNQSLRFVQNSSASPEQRNKAIREALNRGQISTVKPEWQHLDVGDVQFQVQ